MIERVIKRDGRIKPFDLERIKNAIQKAYKEVYDDSSIIKFENDYTFIKPLVLKKIMVLHKDTIEIEEIQNLIIDVLKAVNPDVAKAYREYRDERTKQRDKKSELSKKIEEVLLCKNIQNSNANVDEYSFGGRKFESASIIHKEMALNVLMRKVVADAHRENRVYQHDLDSYDVGMHNCLNIDFPRLLSNGFVTRNGDVRPANSVNTFFQLMAVIFQCQSQVQYGGCGSMHLDYDAVPYVRRSFTKHYKVGLKYLAHLTDEEIEEKYGDYVIKLDDERYKELNPTVWQYAYDMLNKEGLQSAQAFYHNLNTLESRAGSQLPFTSINLGRNTTIEGRLINKWIFLASIDGIGKHHTTSIFPISIFQYKKGVNDKEGTPNYDIKRLAIKSLAKRIYPNIVNGDYSMNIEDPNNPDTFMGTMGCRTMVGYDRFGLGYSKVGRGNISPVTINLVKIGIKNGICLKTRSVADLKGFWEELDEVLEIATISLVDRFNYICSQNPKSAPFMYKNGTVVDCDKVDDTVYEALRHGTLALGYIGVAEMCQALFGKDHADDDDVHKFALSVIKYIHDYANTASDKYNLNFSAYATPAENLCKTMMIGLKKEFGVIPNVTEKDYLTNSHHVPVWKEISIYKKLEIEAPFCKYPTGGCITYIELDSAIMSNEKAIEDIIDYAMSLDIPYLAFNFPIDSCLDCGHHGEFNDSCPICGSKNIQQLRRVTGYLTTDYRNFNAGKIAECLDRVKHSKYTYFAKGD